MAAVSALSAQPPPPTVAQLDHTVWTSRDGAPAAVNALAQSADGVLWVGTTTGLYQFDGARFEPFEPRAGEALPSLSVYQLLALPDGTLWIGYSRGGVSLLAGGRLTNWPPGDGLPRGTVTALARGRDGEIWASTTTGLARWRGGRWERLGPESGYPGGVTSDLLVDRSGAVWAAAKSGVFVLPRGATRFERRAPSLDPSGGGSGMPRQAPDGSIWATSLTLGLTRLADASGAATPPFAADEGLGAAFGLLLDRHGNAWVGARAGLVHVRLSARKGGAPVRSRSQPPVLSTPVPLASGALVLSLLEDREGNVWVGTNGGLERFHETKLTPVDFPRPVVQPSLAPGASGAVWVGPSADPLLIVSDDGVATLPGWPHDVSCAYRDLGGGLWLGGSEGLWHSAVDALTSRPRFTHVALPAEIGGGDVQATALGLNGDLWVSKGGPQATGVYRRRGGTWSKVPLPTGITEERASLIVADRSGRTWLGYVSQPRLALVSGTSTRVYGAADGLDVGAVTAVYVRGGHVWVGGEKGVALFEGARFQALVTTERLRGITGIVETADGDLWCNGAGGVTHVAATEIARALQDPTYRARCERLDYHDGLHGQAPQVRPFPTAVQGTDGRLWFTTDAGVAWIDPANIRRNLLPPPVFIRAVTAAGRRYEPGGRIALPPRTTDLTIAYTAVSLSMPDRVRFRYRLTGVDPGAIWEDAGDRREARYTNLAPGSYRFQVVAANEDGVWNEKGATVEFAIPATFTQTKAFVALCLALAAVCIWLLALWRQRRIAHTLRAQFETTLAERTRVARELHDTLLGDMAGVAMQLSAASRRAETAGAADATLAGLLAGLGTQVQQALTEARRSVTAMRQPPEDPSSLADRLSESAYRALAGSAIVVDIERAGTPRRYPESVEAEVVRIASEAMTNARQHAGCRRVEISCTYGSRHLQVRVRDDGRGFDPHEQAPSGHWGLVGMRERAAAIGAQLAVTSAPGAGTEVLLVVSASAWRRRWRWTASARSQGA
jgi:signal transduction histidine kinase/ligand-binding sensor domain-containing protein